MKSSAKYIAIACAALALTNSVVRAGEAAKSFKETVVTEEPKKWWGAALSTGWDSLYMFRGVNVLRFDKDGNKQDYGSSLYWTDLNVSFYPWENGTFNIGAWMAFGLTKSTYKEFDAYASYTHTFGDLAVSLGYTFYYYIGPVRLYQNELNAKVAYTIKISDGISITPSLTYYFNVGPEFHNFEEGTGAVKVASSYLLARVDGSISIYKDIVSLAPWVGFGTNFEYNAKVVDDGAGYDFFTGANNVEVGLAIPVKINDIITVSVYGAYSYQWYGLVGTEPSTFWGGGKVTFAF